MKAVRRFAARILVAAAQRLLKIEESEPFDHAMSRFVDELIELDERLKKGDA